MGGTQRLCNSGTCVPVCPSTAAQAARGAHLRGRLRDRTGLSFVISSHLQASPSAFQAAAAPCHKGSNRNKQVQASVVAGAHKTTPRLKMSTAVVTTAPACAACQQRPGTASPVSGRHAHRRASLEPAMPCRSMPALRICLARCLVMTKSRLPMDSATCAAHQVPLMGPEGSVRCDLVPITCASAVHVSSSAWVGNTMSPTSACLVQASVCAPSLCQCLCRARCCCTQGCALPAILALQSEPSKMLGLCAAHAQWSVSSLWPAGGLQQLPCLDVMVDLQQQHRQQFPWTFSTASML